jgi:hypothetical protein
MRYLVDGGDGKIARSVHVTLQPAFHALFPGSDAASYAARALHAWRTIPGYEKPLRVR